MMLSVTKGALLLVVSVYVSTAAAFTPVTVVQSRQVAFGKVHEVTFLPSLRLSKTIRKMAGDDDGDDLDEEPLSDGIDSVSWLPSVIGSKGDNVEGAQVGNEILPLFPLGGIVYTPNSEHVLNIFEPRYRQMYTDILMNGTKKFVVAMSHPTDPGRFAKTGVLFELEDLKEVSEQTEDKIKYICNHKVTGRVDIQRVLNPEAWETRVTYLKVEGTVSDDSGKIETSASSQDVYGVVADEMTRVHEKALKDSFADLVNIQHELQEDVRFTKASVATLAVQPGAGKDGLWQTVRLWQSFVDQRLVARQNELQQDFQERLQDFLKKDKGLAADELPSAIGFQDLSPALQEEVKELQKRMAVELKPLVLESTLTMQKILEAKDHVARLKLLKYFIDAERRRLNAKKMLQGMFSGLTTSDAAVPREEMVMEEEATRRPTPPATKPSTQSSIMMDEPDAFQ